MDKVSIIISSISAAVALGSFVWAIINDIKNRKTQQKLAILQGKIDKSNYVSKVVFDKIFSQFQAISDCMFDNYNNAVAKMYPFIDQILCFLPTKKEKVDKMMEYYKQSKFDLNALIKLIQTNRFILTDEMLELLQQFEKLMKNLITWYDSKIHDVANDSIAKFVTPENEKELSAKADSTLTLYNKISACFKIYIERLQIAE